MKINPTKTVNELITALSYIIDIEGNRKIYHVWRTSILSAKVAKNITSPEKLKEIFYASMLHDVGGVELYHHIIHYLKRHDKASQNLLLSHPIIAAQIVSTIPRMTNVAKLILDHHEWINGAGYPRAKIEKHIPLGSQVIRISDSIDIAFNTGRFAKLSKLKNKMSLNINKEYSKTLFIRAFNTLKQNRFFYKIRLHRNIPLLFKEIRDEVGYIHIPIRIDAIGIALEAMAQIIDMKHPFTWGHSLRVARYAMACALVMKLEHDEITQIRWAGLIHDIGKLNVARRILDKPARLTRKEFWEVRKHASLTKEIMEMIPSLKDIADIASGHHEYFDGTGYPQGLKTDQIPLGARILFICDAFDAMTSSRPYRKPLSPRAACKEIEKGVGTQFDPGVVRQVLPLFKSMGL